jgi:hypothetical protein
MQSATVIVIAFALSTNSALAACEFVTGPCGTDSRGNTYRTEQNFGGGYTTYQNGTPYSSTGQTLNGSWRERYNDGNYRTYNYDPYEAAKPHGYGTR